jgi:hypothetical protein
VSDSDRAAELEKLAHDVRNALNGAAVNLEVARSRAQRGIDVAQVAPYIDTAAQQLDAAGRLHKHYTDAVAAAMNDSAAHDTTHDDSASTIQRH